MKVQLDIDQSEITRMLRQIRVWQAKKRAQIIDLIEDTAKAIQEDAQSRVPAQSGKLKKRIRVLLRHVADELGGFVVADEFYANFIELGTAHARAHPFMLPAFEVHIQGFLLKLRKILSS